MKTLSTLAVAALVGATLAPSSAATLRRSSALPSVAGGLAPTLTQAFPLSTLKGTDLGTAPATTALHVVVALTPRNDAAIPAILHAQNTPGNAMYHKYFKPAQTKAEFSPSSAQVEAVESYMTSKGYKNLSVSSDNMFINAYGTVGMANNAFGANEHVASVGGLSVLENAAAATVPAALTGVVRAVVGLNTLPQHTNIHVRTGVVAPKPNPTTFLMNGNCTTNPATGACLLPVFGPRDFWFAYDVGAGDTSADFRDGINTQIAIFAEGDLTQVAQDLRTQENLYGLPQAQFQFIYPTIPSPDTSGADEWDLDTQTSSGVAGNVKLLDVYVADSLTDPDTLDSYEAFKAADVDKAGSASYGECDYLAMTDGSLTVDDSVFGQEAVQGQTMFASAGDTGGNCFGAANGVNAGLPGQEYPGDSKYVIDVGGTSLFIVPNGNYNGEIAWVNGGGGLSAIENDGYWQTASIPGGMNPEESRFAPDIAAAADENLSPAAITVSGATEEVGGTSVASPLELALWTRIESVNNNRFGFAAPIFYQEFQAAIGSTTYTPGYDTETVNGFNDVVLGSNGNYTATPGYDLITGLGSLDVNLQLQYLSTLP